MARYEVLSEDFTRETPEGIEYDFFKVKDTERPIIYEVRFRYDLEIHWVRNQQTGQILKQGGATHDAIVAAIIENQTPEPEPEPDPEPEPEPEPDPEPEPEPDPEDPPVEEPTG